MAETTTKFKETEIGPIPEEWEVAPVGEFCSLITSGGTPSRKRLEYYKGGTIPWVKTQELDDAYIFETQEKITEKALKESSAKLLPEHTISMAMYGATVGKLGILGMEAATNQACCNMVVNEGADYRYLYYALLYRRPKLVKLASGAAQQNLNAGLIKQFMLPKPGLDEQKRIASILSSLDDKIELNRQINANLEKIASALFKRWFVDFEFPDENGKPYKSSGGKMVESELGEIPEGWRISRIGDEVRVVGGSTPSTTNPEYWGGDICWATPKDLSNLVDPIILDTEDKITNNGLAQISSGVLPIGTVLLSSRAPIGYLAITEAPLAINQGFIAMICKNLLSRHYIHLWVKRNMEVIKSLANGSTFLEVNKSNFRTLSVVVPDNRSVELFDNQTEQIHQRILESVKESKVIIALRDSLLSRLMSGRIRV